MRAKLAVVAAAVLSFAPVALATDAYASHDTAPWIPRPSPRSDGCEMRGAR